MMKRGKNMQIEMLKHEDKERYLSFNKLVFDNERLEDELEKLMYRNPFSKLEEDCFYIEEDGQIVSSLILTKKNAKVGRTKFKVGEYDIVGTDPNYRGKGYCRELMEYSFEVMKKNDIFLCRLIGIPDFYQQFGFEYAVPAYFYNYVNIKKDKIKNCKRVYSVEKISEFSDEILTKMIEIFQNETSDNFGSESRSVDYFRYMIEEKTFEKGSIWYGVYNKDDLMGYAWIKTNENMIVIKEVVILDDIGSESLCSKIFEMISDKEMTDIGIRIPLNNSFAKFVYSKGATFSCNNELFEGTWGEMYKILDLKKALIGILDILNDRLNKSKYNDFEGCLSIVCGCDKATLTIENGKIRITEEDGIEIAISMGNFTSVYTGYKPMEYYDNDISYPSNQIKLLFGTLFPKGHPYIWTLDINDSLNEIEY